MQKGFRGEDQANLQGWKNLEPVFIFPVLTTHSWWEHLALRAWDLKAQSKTGFGSKAIFFGVGV